MELSEELLKKYREGSATPEEARKALQWFNTTEGKAYLEKNIGEDFENLGNQKWIFEKELDAATILKNIYKSGEGIPMVRRTSRLYRIAAGLIFMATLLATYLYYQRPSEILYKTTFGERKEITLPDQSKVVLNGNSSLKILSDWKENDNREVWLKGEGFFDVVHTRNHNHFVVYTSDNFNIQVLGTQFNVSSRQDRTTVALEKGKVQLTIDEEGKTSQVVMKPGEVVEYDRSSSFLIKKEIAKVESIASWKEGVMELEQTSVKEIASLLENTYGLRMIIDDPRILDQKISGSIPNANIDLFLKGLAEILEVKIKREEGVVYLTKN
jgi:transmembrane sensor